MGKSKTIVGIHYDLGHDKLVYQSQKFLKILEHNKIETRLLYAGDRSFWERVRDCDLVIYQWGHHDYYRQIGRSILPVIESQLNIRCFPNLVSSWLYDDKIREYYFLKELNFPMIESWIFYDEKCALGFAKNARYPLVFKLRSGAGSNMVLLLKNKIHAKQYVKLMFRKGVHYNKNLPGTLAKIIRSEGAFRYFRKKIGKLKHAIKEKNIYFKEDWYIHRNYIMFQKFLPGNSYDTRVVVIGNHACAFQRFNRPNDFRASGSSCYSLDPQGIDLRFIEIAFEISKHAGFDSMAYDFLYDETKQPAIAEISYIFGSRSGSKANQCPGYWDDNLDWHNGRPDVAFFILKHLLNEPNLKNPEG
jgi:glutathione synthase/RimK-type ligase-like ATP-grasp enzyme